MLKSIVIAVAALAAPVAAHAQERSWHKDVQVVVLLDAHTQKVVFTNNPSIGLVGTSDYYAEGNPVPGIGLVVKSRLDGEDGKMVAFAETGTNEDGSQTGLAYAFDFPFVTGGHWTSYVTKDGVSIATSDSGTYTVVK